MRSDRELTWARVYASLMIPVALGLITLLALGALKIPLGRGKAIDAVPAFVVALAALGCAWARERLREGREND